MKSLHVLYLQKSVVFDFVSYSYITQHDILSKDFNYFLCFVCDIEKNANQKAIHE